MSLIARDVRHCYLRGKFSILMMPEFGSREFSDFEIGPSLNKIMSDEIDRLLLTAETLDQAVIAWH